jgi:hypothetical protein
MDPTFPDKTLAPDLGRITNALADVMIDGKISSKTMLLGVHAFLMALVEADRADAGEVAAELSRMSEYFLSKAEPKTATM